MNRINRAAQSETLKPTVMELKSNTLKDFKKALKVWLWEMTFDRITFSTKKWEYTYQATIKGNVLIIYVPGSKKIDGRIVRISFFNTKRKKHTLVAFVHKQIKLAETT